MLVDSGEGVGLDLLVGDWGLDSGNDSVGVDVLVRLWEVS